ncbi:hypothetical protein [Shimia thalassica]|uniref:hypothetical protein n=1 Tax=Shimia thalassica TaxID=1715693 RepID=UPI002736006A|nr:hypothetical protein [Shimia thalassica]MDP2520150.1 hypothetical protein [Shimia thalassica]
MSWKIAVGRMLVTWVGTACVAYGVSYFVVDQRAQSLDTAIAAVSTTLDTSLQTQSDALANSVNALQQSIEILNSTIVGTNDNIVRLTDKIGGLSVQTAQHGVEIGHLKEQVAKMGTTVASAESKVSILSDEPNEKLAAAMANEFVKSLLISDAWDGYRMVGENGEVPQPVFLGLSQMGFVNNGISGIGDFRNWNQSYPNGSIFLPPEEPNAN